MHRNDKSLLKKWCEPAPATNTICHLVQQTLSVIGQHGVFRNHYSLCYAETGPFV